MNEGSVHIVCVGTTFLDKIWTYVLFFPWWYCLESRCRICAHVFIILECFFREVTAHRLTHFPVEDTKTRATQVEQRRGGNPANTIQVLADLANHSLGPGRSSELMHLVTVLPDPDSKDTKYIKDSLPGVQVQPIYHPRHQDAPSSMIMYNLGNGSRTTISQGGNLPEMRVEELLGALHALPLSTPFKSVWIHFEGRNPEILLPCIMQLHAHRPWGPDIKISVECENPNRRQLEHVARIADVVFFSRLWIEVRFLLH